MFTLSPTHTHTHLHKQTKKLEVTHRHLYTPSRAHTTSLVFSGGGAAKFIISQELPVQNKWRRTERRTASEDALVGVLESDQVSLDSAAVSHGCHLAI